MDSSTPPEHEARFLREILAGARAIVYRANPYTLEATYLSADSSALLGFSPTEWQAGGFRHSRLHPDDRERVIEESRDAVRRLEAGAIEYRMIAADGSVVWMRDIVRIDIDSGKAAGIFGAMIDITDDRRAREELARIAASLAESEERYRYLFERNPLPMYLYDSDTLDFIAVNDAFGYTYGYTRADIATMNLRDIRPTDEIAQFESSIGRSRAGHNDEGIWRHRGKDGRLFDVQIYHRVPKPAERRAGLAVAIDVTERVQAERALRDSRERYAALFDHALDSIMLIGADGRYVDANPAMLAMLGYSREELLSMNSGDLTPPDERARVPGLLSALASEGRLAGEQDVVGKDGRLCHVEFRAVAHVRPGLHMSVMRDVSGRKQMEEKLRASEERYRGLFEGSPLPMWAYDAETFRINLVNQAAVDHYGYTREEFAAMTTKALRPPEDLRRFVEFIDGLGDGSFQSSSWRHRKKDASLIDVDIFNHVVTLDGRRTIITQVHDVTERTRLQDQRDRYQQQLREVGRRLVSLQESERRDLAAELHDRVGQSLSALGIKLQLVESMLAPQQGEAHAVVRESQSILEETGRAIRAVLSELRPAALHDYGLVAAMRGLAAQSRRRYGFEVEVHGPDLDFRPPAEVEAALFRIAQEAVANVAKHARSSRVDIIVRPRPSGLALCIGDDGRGFDPALLRQPGKLSRWGLLMMRERAESVGARMRIRSSPGAGTSVIVSWTGAAGNANPPG